jgi:hypothetical protein
LCDEWRGSDGGGSGDDEVIKRTNMLEEISDLFFVAYVEHFGNDSRDILGGCG